MSAEPSKKTNPNGVGMSRRQFVQMSGAFVAAGIAAPSLSTVAESLGAHPAQRPSTRYNLIFIMTDEERFPQYWPKGWVDQNLPNRKRLADHGLTFNRAFCSSAMCSPSRATFFTGLYPDQHGVKYTLQTGVDWIGQPTLQTSTQNMARMLASAGYDVQYRGKWHMSKDPSGLQHVQSQTDLARYGFNGWMPPDSGTDDQPEHFGGGCTSYDTQYADQVAAFLRGVDPWSTKPFALFLMFANPHDIMSYPSCWDEVSASDLEEFEGCDNYGSSAPDCFKQGIELPPTVDEKLLENYKPVVQSEFKVLLDAMSGPVDKPIEMLNYVNFYAYLHKVVDKHIGTVLDALHSKHGLSEKTLVIRLADHGEMGLSHGLREKVFNAYEETIHVPMVISNPTLFPKPVQTEALVSLIDVMPTLAKLVDVPKRGEWDFKGVDLTPIIQDAIENPDNPTATVQESILFATDETSKYLHEPMHIRCLREENWKFAMYFDPEGKVDPEYELYDLSNDPTEYYNMANPLSLFYNPAKVEEMYNKLRLKMEETGTTPPKMKAS